MKRNELVAYLDEYLHINEIADYGPQGLQVESDNDEIERIALAVDVAPQVIEAAASWQADMLLVHHGILWREVEKIAGPLGRRVRLLLQHGMNLYAAHLPLDAHTEVGNNAVLAQMLNLDVTEWWCAPRGTPIGVLGSVARETSLAELVNLIQDELATQARVLAYGPEQVNKVAIISGFGADQIAEAKRLGADTFVTGEMSHANYWAAADHEMNVIFAGHYATETVGTRALGSHLERKFGLDIEFFDFPTGM